MTTHAPNPPIEIGWCSDPGNARELARFFADNITPAYISHSELQGPRALDVGRWRPDIAAIFEREIEQRIVREGGKIEAAGTSYPILWARRADRLVGLAFVSFFLAAPVPYAIVEDIVVDVASRGRGAGKAVLDWIAEEAERVGCARLFLESGVDNHRAHEFFEREGFATCSVVMMKRLAAPG